MKQATKRVFGLVYRSRGVDLLDPAGVHDGDAVGGDHGLALIVRDVDGGEVEFVVQAADFEAHLLAQIGIEVGQRFVEQQHAGLDDHGAGQRHALLLAAGQFGGIAVGEVAEMHGVQHLAELALLDRRAVQAAQLRPKATFSATVMFGQIA